MAMDTDEYANSLLVELQHAPSSPEASVEAIFP